MKHLFLFLSLFAMTVSLRAASLVEGCVFLKNGSVVECTGDDRMQMPKRSGKLKILRDAFRKTKTKELLPAADIDSVICWHTKSPEHPRKFVFAPESGWMWVYVETPYIKACIYSKKGYGIDTNGGIMVWQRRRWFSSSRVAYWLQKRDDSEFQDVGSTYRRSKGIFRERIARYIDDDPELAGRVRQSDAYRDKTILMLYDYDPAKYQLK